MIPLIGHERELAIMRALVVKAADAALAEAHEKIAYTVGTMIELPRACMVADELAAAGRLLQLRHQRSDADHARRVAR